MPRKKQYVIGSPEWLKQQAQSRRAGTSYNKHREARQERARVERAAKKAGTWIPKRKRGVVSNLPESAKRLILSAQSIERNKRASRAVRRKQNQRYWERVKAGLVAGPQNRNVVPGTVKPELSEQSQHIAEVIAAEIVDAKRRMSTPRNKMKAAREVIREMKAKAGSSVAR